MPLSYSIFGYFCSKNRTSHDFHHFIDIPSLISRITLGDKINFQSATDENSGVLD